MPRLYNWYIDQITSYTYILRGNVTGHRRLQDSLPIHTSPLLSLSIDPQEPEQFLMQTQHTEYHCSMLHCCYEKCRSAIMHNIPAVNSPIGFSSWAARLEEYAQKYEKTQTYFDIPEHSILLRLGNNQPYYFDSMNINLGGGNYLTTHMIVHSGMFQDSVLCMVDKSESDLCDLYDLRYFPYQKHNLEFYHWNVGDLSVYIENCGDHELRLRTLELTFSVQPNERILIIPENATPNISLTSTMNLYSALY